MSQPKRIKEGDTLPSATLRLRREGRWQQVPSQELFLGRRVILFGLPGAFTPTCSTQHLPRFEELAPVFLALGIDLTCS
jgi:peroxiredoxin